ncbi:MAG: ABC transporter [Betaproteobacteria bacterium HGW-Betaproteobacteria-7]|jgi:zinc transport system permease protein|nr:MAG: ABC transporter [Betaproteobacteria bacterium HGW-Betaproteobacteria-7]
MWFELFLVPFLTGLLLAIVLPLLGCYLRLRDEWLAALAYAHVAAAGALTGLVVGLPPVAGGMLAAALAGAGKRFAANRLAGGASYALLMLAGWSVAVLLAANQPLAERLAQALFDGQLYFADGRQLALVAGGTLLALCSLRALSGRLLLARLYPDLFRLRGLPLWPVQLGFDLLAAVLLALATMSLGVMATFALLFVSPWLAFRRGRSWRHGLLWAVLGAVLAYSGAFALALLIDQPFGPVLALLLVLLGVAFA